LIKSETLSIHRFSFFFGIIDPEAVAAVRNSEQPFVVAERAGSSEDTELGLAVASVAALAGKPASRSSRGSAGQ